MALTTPNGRVHGDPASRHGGLGAPEVSPLPVISRGAPVLTHEAVGCRVADGTREDIVLMARSSASRACGTVRTDGEAAYVSLQGTRLTYRGRRILQMGKDIAAASVRFGEDRVEVSCRCSGRLSVARGSRSRRSTVASIPTRPREPAAAVTDAVRRPVAEAQPSAGEAEAQGRRLRAEPNIETEFESTGIRSGALPDSVFAYTPIDRTSLMGPNSQLVGRFV